MTTFQETVMRPRPEQPSETLADIDLLHAVAEREAARRRDAYAEAKAESRSLHRRRAAARRRVLYRAAPRLTCTAVRIGLAMCGTIAFIIGIALFALGLPGSTEMLGAAAAAWSLAAVIPATRH